MRGGVEVLEEGGRAGEGGRESNLEDADCTTKDGQEVASGHNGARDLIILIIFDAESLLGVKLLIGLDGLLDSRYVHHSREDVDDTAAQDGAGKRGKEPQITHHHSYCRSEEQGAHSNKILGALRGVGVAGGSQQTRAEAVEAERVPKEDRAPNTKTSEHCKLVVGGIAVEDETV